MMDFEKQDLIDFIKNERLMREELPPFIEPDPDDDAPQMKMPCED